MKFLLIFLRVESPWQATISVRWLEDQLESKGKQLRTEYKERYKLYKYTDEFKSRACFNNQLHYELN